ncbi:ATP-binding protein [Streptomyces sp. SP2-10]|uniref:ATP-binding protein n=1 Tax=Streptomyces sp. SP2-10 TaxID=2873385 RepID=UPI001CA7A871|nr:ATP-binding protein [Streptomyces sp. SP2-10]MBY8846958.1 ATP-binding protein [Streptomyces sp. SP2-10]
MNQEISTPVPNFTAQLSPTPRGARLARLLAGAQLRTWGLPLDPAELIVGELATNAATHGRVAGRDFRLTLYVVGDTLRIEVTDTRGDRLPCPVSAPAADADGGRGLLLVAALAERWGTAPGLPPRKTVWAEVRVGTAEVGIGRAGSGHNAPTQHPGPTPRPEATPQAEAAPQAEATLQPEATPQAEATL